MRSRPTRSRRLATTVACATATVLVAALGGCASSEASELETTGSGDVVLRYLGSPGSVNLAELADALGYLDGIELRTIGNAQGGPEQLRSLANGDADFANGPFNGATARVVATGLDVTAVVAAYGSSDDVEMSLLAEDGAGIDDAHDLVGRTVGVNTLGANSEAIIDTYLRQEGLSPDEIEDVALVPLPGSALEGSLRQGQVDAALLSFASREHALSVGGLTELTNDVDVVGEYTGGATVLPDRLLDEHPEVAERFVAGVARAVEFQRTHSRDEVLDVYADWLVEQDRGAEVEALALWSGSGIPRRGGVLAEDDFAMWLDWLEAKGEVEPGALDPAEVFTNDYNPYAEESTA